MVLRVIEHYRLLTEVGKTRDNIAVDLKKSWLLRVGGPVDLAQDRYRWRDLVKTAVSLWRP